MTRLYSLLTVKKLDEYSREIFGVASTGETDRQGDIVEPLGLKAPSGGVSLLWQHDHGKPVGWATFDRPTAKGITFRAKLPKPSDPSPFRDLVEMAWGALVSKTVRGVSIGFRPLEAEPLGGGGMRWKKAELLEISLVSVPANASATVTTIKRLATGHEPPRVVKLDHPVCNALDAELARDVVPAKGLRPVDDMLIRSIATSARTADECFAQLDERISRLEQGTSPRKSVVEMNPEEFLEHMQAQRMRLGIGQ